MGRRKAAAAYRPTLRPWTLPRLAIVCPTCREHIGQCGDEVTRSLALRTHAHDCPGIPRNP